MRTLNISSTQVVPVLLATPDHGLSVPSRTALVLQTLDRKRPKVTPLLKHLDELRWRAH